MTDDELDAIEEHIKVHDRWVLKADVLALVAEVRRLRAELDHIADRLDASAERANQGRDGRSFGLRHAAWIVRDMREDK